MVVIEVIEVVEVVEVVEVDLIWRVAERSLYHDTLVTR